MFIGLYIDVMFNVTCVNVKLRTPYFRWNITIPEQYALQHTDTMTYITQEVRFFIVNEYSWKDAVTHALYHELNKCKSALVLIYRYLNLNLLRNW